MKKFLLMMLALLMFGIGQGQQVHRHNPGVSQAPSEAGDVIQSPVSPANIVLNNNTDYLQTWALPTDGSTSGNTRCPGNTYRYQRTEYLITAAEMAASGFPSGNTIDGIGFLIATAGGTTQTGNFSVWLKNTTDVTYSLGALWTTTGFTQVSNIASWTVPITAGSYTVNFSGGSAFTYTGGGVYVAWEFNNPSGALGTTALIANCNVSLTGGLYGARSSTAMPTTLTASNWRPATIFTNNTLVDVVQVTNIYVQEKCPVPYGVPTNLSARVYNPSSSAQTFDVTMTITDQTTSAVRYTETQTVTALAASTGQVVNFTPFNASFTENDNVTVSIPALSGETFISNNTKVIPMNVNTNLYGYCYNLTPSTGYGYTYTGAGGIFAAKFHMNGSGTITGANLFIYNYAANAGNNIYAVVLNSAGTIVGQSATLTIASGDLGTNKNFTFPSAPSFSNEDFFVGLAQPTGGTAQWYPMGCMAESPYRANTYYSFAITGGTPNLDAIDYKYMIEAQVGPPPSVLDPSNLAAAAVSSSEIDLSWTLNANNNNVLLAFNTVSTFGTPVNGTTYSAGNTIPGGGTVLQYSNGTTFNHTLLNPNTPYYYKAWSYNGSIYSPGTIASAQTWCAETPAPWQEGFEATTFPPTCWDGSSYWTRSATVGGFGTSTASAKADFYNIAAGTTFALFTLPFNNGSLGAPTLSFDYAYATYAGEVDELDIYYSTDGGLNFSILLAMPGGSTGILNTGGATTAAFVPTASQWATKTISLPAGTNMIAFNAVSAYGNNLYVDNVQIIEGLLHDVGVSALDTRQAFPAGTVIPVATIRNSGGSTETFNVTMTIGTYSSTKTVTALAPGLTTDISFDPWSAVNGTYTMQVCTQLGTDLNTANDCASQTVVVASFNKTVYAYNAFPASGTDPEGPTSFNLNDPGVLNSLADQNTLNFIAAGTWANGLWYGVEYNTVAPFNLITIDPVTGARTVVGDMGFGMNGLSYNTANNTMYGVSSTTLYSINLTTGAATMIGTANTGILMINLAINTVGVAYAIDITNDKLGTVDLTTGLYTPIGSVGFNASYAQDMEFDRETGNLFVAAYDQDGWLGLADVTTGSVYKVGYFEGGAEITGFSIPYNAVTFNIDMSTASGFVPGTDVVYIAGGFPNAFWNEPGTNGTLALSQVGTSLIYTKTLILPSGTYEYKYFKNAGWANGEWNGGSNRSVAVSGSVVLNDTWGGAINWANLQWPGSGTISVGNSYNVYAQAYIQNGITQPAGATYGLQAWIGYNTTDTDPSTWTNWIPAPFFGQSWDNDEFMADLGAAISTPGTYYYASRFQFGNMPYVYGGFSGGFWNGTTNVSGVLTVNSGNKALNVTLLLEGLASDRGLGAPPAGTMFEAYDENGIKWGPGIADVVTIELRDGVLGTLIYTISDVQLTTLGALSATVPSIHNGDYYIYVRHRNSITTSTAAPVSFAGGTITYDFTSGTGQALGDNMKMISGFAHIFAGDENVDGLVDSTDLNDCDNDSAAFAAGYLATDANGDGLVDSSDLNLIDNNNAAFVGSVLPF